MKRTPMNELSSETSPYLLQHAGNPIYWKAWNETVLKKAKDENKLIILSVGYSACHWCHVMEHESFEDEEVAALMNSHYISIKVDREERPDVDAVYMKAVQLMTGRGGWPMNVVLLPDGRPVWGGTYFAKKNWMEALEQLQELYKNEPEKVVDYAEKLLEGIQYNELIANTEQKAIPETEALNPLVEKWAKSFDDDYGGYARAPKFMLPNNYLFLQRYGYQAKKQDILDFVDLTLIRMAWGGLFDTIGGGFSRYSVDLRWHLPHFEKMLYDNGQLMSLYAEAYKRTKNPLYKEVIEKIHFFISTELTDKTGAFYSALDADSLDAKGKLEEGAFYVWKKQELIDLLGDDFELFARVFNINKFGYWEHDNFVLIQNQPLEETAQQYSMALDCYITPEELKEQKTKWEKLLYAEREKRQKPRLDDKILTSWNAIMLKGYTDAYKALGEEKYLAAANKNAAFITAKMWNEGRFLWRTYKNGTAKIKGFLEDYAHTADAFISLYEATLNETWLHFAKQLCDYSLEQFYDDATGFFRFNSGEDERLVAEHFETEDNVIPASNSVMANVLYKLSILYNNPRCEQVALEMLATIIPNTDYASAFSNWLNLWLATSSQNRELAITGPAAETHIKLVNSNYLPQLIIAGSSSKSALPFLKNRFVKDTLMFYVCKNKTCNLPTPSFKEAISDININQNKTEI